MNKVRIGTRGSKLALRQAELVREALLRVHGGIETELVVLRTKGDIIQDRPFREIGEKGVFVSELEQALLEERIDLAVHSAKDLPVSLAEGLTISAVLPRGDVRDVLVVPKGAGGPFFTAVPVEGVAESTGSISGNDGGIDSMAGSVGDEEIGSMAGIAEGINSRYGSVGGGGSVTGKAGDFRDTGKQGRRFVIGTGSRRRQAQAVRLWDGAVCRDIRGNVDSRLRKLEEEDYDGILLAKAGLDRLGMRPEWEERFDFYPLSPEVFLPAACQGIIAVETGQFSPAAALCGPITDLDTELCFLVERRFLSCLGADCSTAAAAWCRREGDSLALDVMYAADRCRYDCKAEPEAGLRMAERAAERFLAGKLPVSACTEI